MPAGTAGSGLRRGAASEFLLEPDTIDRVGRVSRGERFTLPRRGVPVAMLVPVTRCEPVAEVIAELRAFRKGRRLGGLSLRELIKAGRKW